MAVGMHVNEYSNGDLIVSSENLLLHHPEKPCCIIQINHVTSSECAVY